MECILLETSLVMGLLRYWYETCRRFIGLIYNLTIFKGTSIQFEGYEYLYRLPFSSDNYLHIIDNKLSLPAALKCSHQPQEIFLGHSVNELSSVHLEKTYAVPLENK